MRDSEYNCAVASSEYNEALRAREYAPAREYGATEQRHSARKKRSSARQRALMQATAAMMTVVVAVSAAAGSVVQDTLFIPEEYRIFLDGLLDVCGAGTDEDIIAYVEQPLRQDVADFISEYRKELRSSGKAVDRLYYDGYTLTTDPRPVPAVSLHSTERYDPNDAWPHIVRWNLTYVQSGREKSDARFLSKSDSYKPVDGATMDEWSFTSFNGVEEKGNPTQGTYYVVDARSFSDGRPQDRDDSAGLVSLAYVKRITASGEFVMFDATEQDFAWWERDLKNQILFLEDGFVSLDYAGDFPAGQWSSGAMSVSDGWLEPNSMIKLEFLDNQPNSAVFIIANLPGNISGPSWTTPVRGDGNSSLYHTRFQMLSINALDLF